MSHAPTPQPRPALRKAPDGSIHPASAVLSSLAVTIPDEPDATSGKRNGKAKPGKKVGKGKRSDTNDLVQIQVDLPKPVRKALRKRAAEYGWTAEEAAAHVLRVWADT